MNRSEYIKSYKKLTGKTEYRGVKFPHGLFEFWKKAYEKKLMQVNIEVYKNEVRKQEEKDLEAYKVVDKLHKKHFKKHKEEINSM